MTKQERRELAIQLSKAYTDPDRSKQLELEKLYDPERDYIIFGRENWDNPLEVVTDPKILRDHGFVTPPRQVTAACSLWQLWREK